MSVTIYDVAAKAEVSIKTVSRVMNKEPNVRPLLRDRVLAAAETLGYHPNLSARSLAGSRSFVIAVFVDAALTLEHWRERGADYLSRVQLGATLECRQAGYHLLIELIDHAAPRQAVTSLLGALKPDGVILTPPTCDDPVVLALLDQAGAPYVRLGPEGLDGPAPRVTLDDVGAARGMTEHLIGLGHRRIGFVSGDPRHGASRARRQGYLDAMAAHGLPVADAWLRDGDFTFQSGLTAGQALLGLSERPTAIFASNDDMALGCLTAAGEAGLAVPGQVSIAGFDDAASARFSQPPLTTVRHPLVEMAAIAARLLISGVARSPERTATASDDLPPFDLVIRASTAPPGLGR
jgi:LacI family transcriptional regulator